MCRYIIFNNTGYIYSINTILRQKVCAHKRHRNIVFFRIVRGKMSKFCAVWVHILFVSQMCLLSDPIEYNVSAHLRHNFMASHNKKMGYFWNLGLFKAKIVNFEDPPWTFLVFGMSICPLYMLTIYIWPIQKWLVRQSMCTHVAHTLHFSKKFFFGEKIFQLWDPCVPCGCTYFVSLYIF